MHYQLTQHCDLLLHGADDRFAASLCVMLEECAARRKAQRCSCTTLFLLTSENVSLLGKVESQPLHSISFSSFGVFLAQVAASLCGVRWLTRFTEDLR